MKQKKIFNRLFASVLAAIITISMVTMPSVSAADESAQIATVNLELPTGGVNNVDITKVSDFEGAEFFDPSTTPNAISNGTALNGNSTYAYNLLKTAEKTAYDVIKTAVSNFAVSSDYSSKTLSDDYYIEATISITNSSQIKKIINSFFYDNPQFYWLKSGAKFTIASSSCTVGLSVDSYYYTPSARSSSDSAISSTAQSWYTQISKKTSDYEKAMLLHDLIIAKIDYSYISGTNTPQSAIWAHNIDGVLGGKGAVCESYARTFQYMLNILEIGNVYIVGNGGGAAHAWNAVQLDNKYYLVDVTWDDFNEDKNTYGADGYYDYFCISSSVFGKKHTAFTSGSSNNWLYSLPTFADSTEYVYYYKYKSLADSSVNTSNAAKFVETAQNNSPGDYVYYVASSTNILSIILNAAGINSSSALMGTYGYLVVADNIKINTPSTSISLDKTSVNANLNETLTLTASMNPTNSDDRIIWSADKPRLVSINSDGNNATITVKRNGTAVISATTRASGKVATCTITCGTGIDDVSDYEIWAGGAKNYKSVTITPSISASDYIASNGKNTAGKLVWVVKNEPTTIEFNSTTHKIVTKSDNTVASVSSKGVVSAKSSGTAYVYACDTGSLNFEEFIVEVKQAPTKLILNSVAGSDETDTKISKLSLAAGEVSQNIYITPISKNNDVDPATEYTIAFAKEEQSSYAALSEIYTDSSGNCYFNVTGKNVITSGNTAKTAKVSVIIVNKESGKKLTCAVTIYNPVTSVTATLQSGKLAAKGDTAILKLNLTTGSGNELTTDKAKIYVSAAMPDVAGNKVISFSSTAAIKATLTDATTITLTASKAASVGADIYIAYTDSVNKTTSMFIIAHVDAEGNVTVVE